MLSSLTQYKSNLISINVNTPEDKHTASRAEYKAANKEKVERASKISNYRPQAKRIPEIIGREMEAVYKWIVEQEDNRKA